ncbi:MAG: methyltransferase domain-containing protein [Pirellulales bacterium]|nr:methyltransferase domain-containing protein [Pirellulales bacterium]
MHSRWTDYRIFWREFRRTYHSTGAISPSGKPLAQALTHFVRHGLNTGCPRRILEVGPGTGAVTVAIAEALRPADQLDLVELNDRFVERLRKRLAEDPRLAPVASRTELIHGDLRDLPHDRHYDVIVSGLPMNNFSVDLVENLLDVLRQHLAPGGMLSFFEYIAIRRFKAFLSLSAGRQRLRGIDRVLNTMLDRHQIRRDRILPNIPPAWVHHVQFS